MSDSMTSRLSDSDMQGAPKALLRAAQRARDIARQTNTPLVLMRDGVLVEEYVNGIADSNAVQPNGAGEKPTI